MRKYSIIALVLVVGMAASIYADTGTEARRSFFFSTGYNTNTIFNHNAINLLPHFQFQNYSFGLLSGNIEFPLRFGFLTAGLETGYSSGSMFGGTSGIDLIPIALSTAFYFSPAQNIFYFGPRLTFGGLGFKGSDWFEMIPMMGGRLDLEFRIPNIPFGIYSAAGVNVFPSIDPIGVSPILEFGLRFPRSSWQLRRTRSNGTEYHESYYVTSEIIDPEPDPSIYVSDYVSESVPEIPSQIEAPPALTLIPSQVTQEEEVPPALTLLPEPEPEIPSQVIQEEEVPPVFIFIPEPEPEVPSQVTQEEEVPPALTLLPEPEPEIPSQPIQENLPIGPIQSPMQETVSLSSIYFEPDTAVLIETSRTALDAVGREMAADPALKIHLRAYTAPFRTATGRLLVSEARANFSRDYLIQNYGISPDRITTELFGSEKAPRYVTDDWTSYRCVELITYDGRTINQISIDPVYFEPDTAVLINTSITVLEALGQELAADPTLRVHLRAYTAPFGTPTGRLLVSQARANFSRDYLILKFGIASDRITTELFGSNRTPEHVTNDWTSYRCVEFIIHRKETSYIPL